jgi:dienelactone hydrolase
VRSRGGVWRWRLCSPERLLPLAFQQEIDDAHGRVIDERQIDVLKYQKAAMPQSDYPLSAHPENPTVLVYAAEDELFEPDWERFMARELLGAGVELMLIVGAHVGHRVGDDTATGQVDGA